MKKRLTRSTKIRKLTPARHGGRHDDTSSKNTTDNDR
jgi:hypothetical protein